MGVMSSTIQIQELYLRHSSLIQSDADLRLRTEIPGLVKKFTLGQQERELICAPCHTQSLSMGLDKVNYPIFEMNRTQA